MTHRSVWYVVTVLALGPALIAQTTERERAAAQADRVNDRIVVLQREADRLAGQSRTLLGDLRALELEQQVQSERVQQAQAAAATGEAAIADAAMQLEILEQQRVRQLPDLKSQLVDIYKRGRTGYAHLLFGTRSVREFGRATRAVAALMRINERRVAEHRRTFEALRGEHARLEEELRNLQAQEAEARAAQAAADRAVAARVALISQIDTRRDLNAQLAGELQLAYEQLQAQLARFDTGQPVTSLAIPLMPFRGVLDWPVVGKLAVGFRQRSGRLADAGTRSGVEIAAPQGSAVYAIHPGTVSYGDPFAGFGNLVIVDHGGSAYSLYGYLDSISVPRGAAVHVGTELGRVGSPPTGPSALYFELRVDGRPVDPVQWLKSR